MLNLARLSFLGASIPPKIGLTIPSQQTKPDIIKAVGLAYAFFGALGLWTDGFQKRLEQQKKFDQKIIVLEAKQRASQ